MAKLKINMTRPEAGSGEAGPFAAIARAMGEAEQVTLSGLSFSGGGGAFTPYTKAVRGENFMDGGHATSAPVTRGIKHAKDV
jgi:pyruvate/2-oxoacid:ferredoxin oxidoreductase beta subunit